MDTPIERGSLQPPPANGEQPIAPDDDPTKWPMGRWVQAHLAWLAKPPGADPAYYDDVNEVRLSTPSAVVAKPKTTAKGKWTKQKVDPKQAWRPDRFDDPTTHEGEQAAWLIETEEQTATLDMWADRKRRLLDLLSDLNQFQHEQFGKYYDIREMRMLLMDLKWQEPWIADLPAEVARNACYVVAQRFIDGWSVGRDFARELRGGLPWSSARRFALRREGLRLVVDDETDTVYLDSSRLGRLELKAVNRRQAWFLREKTFTVRGATIHHEAEPAKSRVAFKFTRLESHDVGKVAFELMYYGLMQDITTEHLLRELADNGIKLTDKQLFHHLVTIRQWDKPVRRWFTIDGVRKRLRSYQIPN